MFIIIFLFTADAGSSSWLYYDVCGGKEAFCCVILCLFTFVLADPLCVPVLGRVAPLHCGCGVAAPLLSSHLCSVIIYYCCAILYHLSSLFFYLHHCCSFMMSLLLHHLLLSSFTTAIVLSLLFIVLSSSFIIVSYLLSPAFFHHVLLLFFPSYSYHFFYHQYFTFHLSSLSADHYWRVIVIPLPSSLIFLHVLFPYTEKEEQ